MSEGMSLVEELVPLVGSKHIGSPGKRTSAVPSAIFSMNGLMSSYSQSGTHLRNSSGVLIELKEYFLPYSVMEFLSSIF